MTALRDRAARVGVVVLDATTRTWGAFWGIIGVWLFYWAWNGAAPTRERFDPYPFVFLTLLITMASYLQNIVLMTDQRKQAIELAELRRRQDEQDRAWREQQEANDARMLNLMQAVNAASQVLIQHAEASADRDVRAERRAIQILTAITGDVDDRR